MAIRDVNDVCVKRAAGTFQTFPERRNGLVVRFSFLIDAQSIRILEWFLLSYLFHDHKKSDDVTHLQIVAQWIIVGHSGQTIELVKKSVQANRLLNGKDASPMTTL